MNQPATLPEKVVDYIGYSSAALEKAAAERQARTAQQTKIAALIPQAVAALVSGERITEDQREKAASVLRDPVKVLELLIKVAKHRNAGEMSMGTPVDGEGVKTAGHSGNGRKPYNSLTDPRVGVRTGHVKQSDVSFYRGLGLTPPAE